MGIWLNFPLFVMLRGGSSHKLNRVEWGVLDHVFVTEERPHQLLQSVLVCQQILTELKPFVSVPLRKQYPFRLPPFLELITVKNPLENLAEDIKAGILPELVI